MTFDTIKQNPIHPREALPERIPIAITAFLSALSLVVALIFSFLPNGATLSHLFILLTPLLMLPPSWLIQRDTMFNQRISRIRYAGIWITVLILDSGFLVLTLQNLGTWDITTSLIHLFLLAMSFLGFWFMLSGTITLIWNRMPKWLGIFAIMSGLLWILMTLVAEVTTFLPHAWDNISISLPYLSLAWGLVHLIWSIGSGVWLVKAPTHDTKVKSTE